MFAPFTYFLIRITVWDNIDFQHVIYNIVTVSKFQKQVGGLPMMIQSYSNKRVSMAMRKQTTSTLSSALPTEKIFQLQPRLISLNLNLGHHHHQQKMSMKSCGSLLIEEIRNS